MISSSDFDYDKKEGRYSKTKDEEYKSRKEENKSSSKQEEKYSKSKDWALRNGRDGRIRGYVLSENEQYFDEHLEQMAKKQTFDFNSMQNVEFKISYQGKDIVEKIELTKYEDLPELNSGILANLKKMKFTQMTPIQRAVIPYMSQGFDLMGCSQTGSGKTIAFLLPILNKMLKEGPNDDDYYKGARPVALVLVPTRELAEQVFKEARKIAHKTGVSVVKIYGAVGKEGQLRELHHGCDILVATPGRLLDFLRSRDISLCAVKYLILDEADRMLDMGFEPQLNSIVYDFDLREKGKRQNLMFSATFETEVKSIARKFMNDFYYVHNNSQMKANTNVTQMIVYAKDNEKILKLHQILQQIKGSIIIFLDTKRGVDNLNNFLERSNYNVIAIHGDKKQFQRQDAIKKFTSGDVPILIATDVASRGLDFPKVSYVFNYDMPSNIDDYIHRIGRTGRCGEKGVAVSFVNENNKNIVKGLYKLLKDQGQECPDFLEKLYNSLSSYPVNNPYQNGYKSRSSDSNDYLNRKRRDDYSSGSGSNTGYSQYNPYNSHSNRPQVNSYSGYPSVSSSIPASTIPSSDLPQQTQTQVNSGWGFPMPDTNYVSRNAPRQSNFSSTPYDGNSINSNNNLPKFTYSNREIVNSGTEESKKDDRDKRDYRRDYDSGSRREYESNSRRDYESSSRRDYDKRDDKYSSTKPPSKTSSSSWRNDEDYHSMESGNNKKRRYDN